VQTGHSVANFSLDIARQLTSGPICLIGQDLAYTNNQTHATGNKGFSVVDDVSEKQRKMFYVDGYYGEKVLTDFVFHGMKKGFEHLILNLRENGVDQKIFNCTEGGVKLEGFEQIPFKDFLEKYCTKDYSVEIKTFIPQKNIPSRKKWEKFYFEVTQLLNQYKDVVKISEEALYVLNKVKKNNYLFNNQLNNKIDEIDEKLKKILENELIFYILRPTIFKIQHSYLESENETEVEANKRIYNKSKILYDGIKTATQQGIFWIEELIRKIEKHL
jgi:hypothetical protein